MASVLLFIKNFFGFSPLRRKYYAMKQFRFVRVKSFTVLDESIALYPRLLF